MENQIIECVPNFSEGRDPVKIQAIADAIASVEGVKLLHVDPGMGANRTVYTFAGPPSLVVEAAFRGIKKAAEVIDMRFHKGEHPRIGATDVCPLVPVANITLEETVAYSRELAGRVGEELGIPVYLYEASATAVHKKNLASIRSGEYEGLEQKMQLSQWKPDFGPGTFNAKAGATVIGARDFLIAYNVNLDTDSVEIANEIAYCIRETGKPLKSGETLLTKDEHGRLVRIPGTLKAVKAIGWYIEEYKKAQVSTNIINFRITPFHTVFEEIKKFASVKGVNVTGSELIGLIPLKPMLDAGTYFLNKKGLSADVTEEILINTAIREMGLDELVPFDPRKKILEYLL